MTDIVNVYEVAVFIHRAIYEAECLKDPPEQMSFRDLLQASVQERYPALSVRQYRTAFAIADEQKRMAVALGVPVMEIAAREQREHPAGDADRHARAALPN